MAFKRTLATAAALSLIATAAVAHHGWAWTTGGNITLTGTLTAARLGNPHGELDIDVNGETWVAEIGQPWRNARAGLTDDLFAAGTEITVDGEPSADPDEKLIKAERIVIAGKTYELYAERS